MSESIFIPVTAVSKEERYRLLLPQIKALVTGEKDLVANLSNIAAALKSGMNFLWIGFYFVKDQELVLGPFQGPAACTRIAFGRGVCGTAWKLKETLIVKNVDEFPGHIACSSESKSEIVIPAMKNGEVFLVLDVDSGRLDDFNETDKIYLEKIIRLIETLL